MNPSCPTKGVWSVKDEGGCFVNKSVGEWETLRSWGTISSLRYRVTEARSSRETLRGGGSFRLYSRRKRLPSRLEGRKYVRFGSDYRK